MEVARIVHAPKSENASELVEWLDRVGKDRRVTRNLGNLNEDVDALSLKKLGETRLVRLAQYFSQWKLEMLDGTGRH